MKKTLIAILALIVTFVSCANQEDIEIAYKSDFTISSASLLAPFYATTSSDFDMKDNWDINIMAFVYSEDGNLKYQNSSQFNSLNNSLNFNLELEPGKYTVVSIAYFSNQEGLSSWSISDESSLGTLAITETDNPQGTVFETLGVDMRDIEVSDRKLETIVDIQPVTALMQIYYQHRAISKIWDGTYEYTSYASSIIPYIEEAKIYQPTFVQTVRFENGEIVYRPLTQEIRYKLGLTHYPRREYEENNSAVYYNYIALLPQNGVAYRWEALYSWGESEISSTTEAVSGLINIESGKQYDMDLIFDVLYLVVGEHDPAMNDDERLNKYMPLIEEQMENLNP